MADDDDFHFLVRLQIGGGVEWGAWQSYFSARSNTEYSCKFK